MRRAPLAAWIALLALTTAHGALADSGAAGPRASADARADFDEMRKALRVDRDMRAEGVLRVRERRTAKYLGDEATFDEWQVQITLVRRIDEKRTTTFVHTRDPALPGAENEHVSLLVLNRRAELSQAIWQPSQRRFVNYSGLRAKDEVLNSRFRFEDWFIGPRADWESGRIVERGSEVIRIAADHSERLRRVVVHLATASHLPIDILGYDRAGQRSRELSWSATQMIDAQPHPMKQRIFDHLTREQSELILDTVSFDYALPRRALRKESIERRLKRGLSPLPEVKADAAERAARRASAQGPRADTRAR